MSNKIHETAVIESGASIGDGVRIGPYTHVGPKVRIGNGVSISGSTALDGAITIGNGCVVEPGVCFAVGPDGDALSTQIGEDVHIGAGSIIARGVVIASGARIEPGTVIDRHVPARAVVKGTPATIVGYLDKMPFGRMPATVASDLSKAPARPAAVPGVTIHELPVVRDLRGDLAVGEFSRSIPFKPQRYFVVFDVPSAETRGEHAHKECSQFLVCVAGSCAFIADDGKHREEVMLNSPGLGLFVPPMIWGIQYKYSRDAVLLVFASQFYDPNDYIRDYGEFLEQKGGR